MLINKLFPNYKNYAKIGRQKHKKTNSGKTGNVRNEIKAIR